VNGLIAAVTGLDLSVDALVIAMLLILLFLGCFVDQVSMMLITLPFFMPLIARYNVDPVWFGVLFLICMQLGLLTPPFGLLLFTMKGVAPRAISMHEIYMAAMPYISMSLAILVLIFLLPAIATWLPAALSR
jgi:TRAP-type C4-dicarboxylate transport system permease large subunit